MADSDVTVLCLPDDAAREAVALAAERCRILDASTAYRVASDWVYGCPELCESQRADIRDAARVSNPGCYPQGFILMIRPLIDAGLLDPAVALRVFGLSGYSGGGRTLIEKYQAFSPEQQEAWNTRPYSLALQHKHVPEMHRYSGTRNAPLFVPSVGNFYRGILVQVPLFVSELKPGTTIDDVHRTLDVRYESEQYVDVAAANDTSLLDDGYLSATALNNTNGLQLMVYGNAQQILLAARYDNLVKGAAGAAIQNLNLMLGAEESTGLNA
jgi:N-acetyl-gamma-glutamyl-phosphate reductase